MTTRGGNKVNKSNQISTKILVLTAALTAMVVVMQLLGSFIHLGVFSISLVLVPIVIGAAMCGVGVGAWLGFVFGAVVLISGDATAFLVVNPFGTIVTVLVKGTLAGFASGVVYKALSGLCASWKDKNKAAKLTRLDKAKELVFVYLPVFAAAVVCPIVNTGVFLVGCNLFFYSTITEWAMGLGYANAANYMIFGLAGGNFLFELLFNVILSPTIVRVIDIFSVKFQDKGSFVKR